MYENNLYTTQQIRILEDQAIQHEKMSEFTLMQRAGHAAFELLIQLWPFAKNISIFCGGGNNGGDGYLVAYLAKKAKLNVNVFACKDPDGLHGAAKEAWLLCNKSKISIQNITDPIHQQSLEQADVIVDALLGIGVRGEITSEFKSIIQQINAYHHKAVFALDVPSGIDVDTGNILGAAIRANHTITFIGLKRGLFTGFANDYCGEIHLAKLGLPALLYDSIETNSKLFDYQSEKYLLKPRQRSASKNLFGHVLIIGGDYGMAGAPRLCAEAALRVGAGLVTVATRTQHIGQINSMRPEMMCYGIERAAQLDALIDRATVIALGPGLGQSTWSKALFKRVMPINLPKVIDADALNLLAGRKKPTDHWILTPHPGEAARLLDISAKQVQTNRFVACQNIRQKYKGITVLKGAGTLVACQEETGICRNGNPGMASAGMGDALTGIIAGLLAQKFSFYDAAKLGVALHARAGDIASQKGERGLLALDLIDTLRELVNSHAD